MLAVTLTVAATFFAPILVFYIWGRNDYLSRRAKKNFAHISQLQEYLKIANGKTSNRKELSENPEHAARVISGTDRLVAEEMATSFYSAAITFEEIEALLQARTPGTALRMYLSAKGYKNLRIENGAVRLEEYWRDGSDHYLLDKLRSPRTRFFIWYCAFASMGLLLIPARIALVMNAGRSAFIEDLVEKLRDEGDSQAIRDSISQLLRAIPVTAPLDTAAGGFLIALGLLAFVLGVVTLVMGARFPDRDTLQHALQDLRTTDGMLIGDLIKDANKSAAPLSKDCANRRSLTLLEKISYKISEIFLSSGKIDK